MTINNLKLQIALATAYMNPYDLCKAVNIQYQTYRRISVGNNCKPATVGKIAKNIISGVILSYMPNIKRNQKAKVLDYLNDVIEECIGYCFYRRNELGDRFTTSSMN